MTIPKELNLKTSRLVLRDFREDDLADAHAYRSDPKAAVFMDDLNGETLEQTETWLQSAIHHNRLRPRSAYNLAITLPQTDEVIGWIGFGDSERHPGPGNHGVGYLVRSDHWGRGYASEALRAVTEFVFTSIDGAFLSAWCDAENPASAKVMEKTGFAFIRQFEEMDPKTSQSRTCLEYGIRPDEKEH